MNFAEDKVVLLFFKDIERDSRFRNDRYLKRLIRPLYHKFTGKQNTSGFYVWYMLLVKALRQAGYDVRLNDYRTAKANPDYPVGLVGYPHLLTGWDLPNPAVLGPSLYDHPSQVPDLMKDPRYRYYILTCDWMKAVFEPVFGDACVEWYAGIDTELWSDTASLPKKIDVLIYDKVRWDRDRYEPEMIAPIVEQLTRRGLKVETVRYGQYQHEGYRQLLRQSRSMIFLCEHETQGMAYQEALSCNVPLLAWDPGFWVDPRRERFTSEPVPTTSVPYWSAECGERFRSYDEFTAAFDTFWSRLDSYTSRAYVKRELSFAGSAARYASFYGALHE